MADQQFLASFGVDIDESGVSRLQKILSENRTLAESLSSAFDAASESVRAFREQVTTDLPTLFSGSRYGNVTENLFGEYAGLKIGLNMTEPKKEMASFTADVKKPIPLVANASGIVSAARTALENVRSLFAETFTLNIRAETNIDRNPDDSSSRNDSRNPEEAGSTFQRMSTGGRFTRPTDVQVAEDGDTEYIIPVKKENRALPLLRQLLSELSPEARQNLTGENKASFLQTEPEGDLARFGAPEEKATDSFSAETLPSTQRVILNDSEESSVKTLPPVRETLAAETFQLPASVNQNNGAEQGERGSFRTPPPVTDEGGETLSRSANTELQNRPRRSASAVVQPLAKPELFPASDALLPPIRETLSTETIPLTPRVILNDSEGSFDSPLPPAPASAPEENSPNLISELLSELKGLATPRQEPAAVPQTVIKENTPALPAPAPAPLPTEKKEEPALSALIPDLRKTFADTDRPLAPGTAGTVLRFRIRGTDKTTQRFTAFIRHWRRRAKRPPFPAPVSATVDRKESLPSDSALPKQNLSDLVSQLSAVLRPAGGTVNNTSNNLSAPVTINVNANGSDANRIGESIYDTAERYLLRTLRGAFT